MSDGSHDAERRMHKAYVDGLVRDVLALTAERDAALARAKKAEAENATLRRQVAAVENRGEMVARYMTSGEPYDNGIRDAWADVARVIKEAADNAAG